MSENSAKHLGGGIAWLGFWLMIGLANFGEQPVSSACDELLMKIAPTEEVI